ncbi:sodium:solute symporter family protein [Natronolimnobius sp. AArcel1]|uniref:sodium:solute symporter family protein n=1 Tax=Natronolimnobius sp. AArcel1 TaxID=1679093 RepID=UPI0013E9EFFC|nr:sodium:solute symporter family protein [Natronolimnobius sp. AArcel1]NGM70660.1 sodium:solute symporter family protein [Natronolimnobius sp. AArcel1]
MLYVGYRTEQWIESSSDFIVSGREINYLVIGAGFAAIGLAGSQASSLPEFAVNLGLLPASLYMLTWCVFLVIFGWKIAPYIRRSGVYTTSEWMEQRFDRRTRIVAAIGSALGIIGVVAAQFVGLGLIITELTDVSYLYVSFAILLITLIYMYLGGLWAVTVNDVIQVVIGAVAMLVVAAWLFITFGSPAWLAANAPEMASLSGTGAMEPIALTFNSPLTWFIGWGALIIGNQYYWIRLVSARSEADAKKGTILGGVLTAVFFSLLLALPGAYVVAAYGLPADAGYHSGGVFGVLLLEMPPLLDAFVLIALISALMSTASTAIIGIVSILIRDVWEPLMGQATTSDDLMGPSRLFTVLIGVAAWVWAVMWQETAALMLALGWSFIAPLVSVVLLGLLWPRLTSSGAFYGITLGIISVLIWQYGPWNLGVYAHETWIGIFVPAIVAIALSFVTEPPYYGADDWETNSKPDTKPSGASDGHRQPDLQGIAVELSKPWTPSKRWNSFVENRGRTKGGLLPTLLRYDADSSPEADHNE